MDFNDWVIASLTLPVRVRVQGAFCDNGREGDLVSLTRRHNGELCAFVDNMTPGDDNNPSRYHDPQNLILLDIS